MNLLFPDEDEDIETSAEHNQSETDSDSQISGGSSSVFAQLAVSSESSVPVEGLMFIGDPHLEARVPGFRSDNYPEVILNKLRWCLNYAKANRLQPFLLGDLFQLPQDNPNWLLSEIIECIDEPLPAIYGNHDVRENSLKANDSINILFRSGHLQLLTADSVWRGLIGNQQVVVGGTVWGSKLPKSVELDGTAADLVVWITHHDILIPGYEEAGRIRPRPISGIDVIVNGHIHRRLGTVVKGHTHWFTPGNISRRSRSDASKEHVPAVFLLRPVRKGESLDGVPASDSDCSGPERPQRLTVQLASGNQWLAEWITVPHQPFDQVFHPHVSNDDDSAEVSGSGFIAELKELTARRTETGAGLMAYLQSNLHNYEDAVAAEVRRLAEEVINGK
jgi:predicted phosphodiesterase